MKTKITYSVLIGYRNPTTPPDDPTISAYSKDFDCRADVARYLHQVRKDCHDVNFVLTDDWAYNDIINDAVDNVFVQVFVREQFGFNRTYSARKAHNIYRPCISLDENDNWIDLNK